MIWVCEQILSVESGSQKPYNPFTPLASLWWFSNGEIARRRTRCLEYGQSGLILPNINFAWESKGEFDIQIHIFFLCRSDIVNTVKET